MNIEKNFETYKQKISYMNSLGYAAGLLHWDGATEAPPKSVNIRAKSIGDISTEVFKNITDKEFVSLVYDLYENKDKHEKKEERMIFLTKEQIDKFKKMPQEEFRDFQIHKAKAVPVWEKAKKTNDYELFKPYLKKTNEYLRKFVEHIGYEKHPYNALIGEYERNMTVDKLDGFFESLKSEVVPLLKNIQDNGRNVNGMFLKLDYDEKIQEKLSRHVLKKMKYDFERGLLKKSEHPFTLDLDVNDVRITTRFERNYLPTALFATIHEGGHALYAMHINEDFSDTPLFEGASMGIHESQSRFYENVLGRRESFWEYFYPYLQQLFEDNLSNISMDDFFRGINKVEPSLIRVEADELTYPLHIMVRYELEKLMVEGNMDYDKLPELWKDKYENYLSIRPEDDTSGVLQDVHWAEGLNGYFPSYALGNAYAAQLEEYMLKEVDVDNELRNGRFENINRWLSEKVQVFGSFLDPDAIIFNATGESLNPEYLNKYLKNKYKKVYDIEV